MNVLSAANRLSGTNAGRAARVRLGAVAVTGRWQAAPRASVDVPVAEPAAAPKRWLDPDLDVTIRRATFADAAELEQLAVLSSAVLLAGEVLVAEVRGELWAACSLSDGRMISDPFRPTRVARSLLELRRRHLVAARAGLAYEEAARFSLRRRWRLSQSRNALRAPAH